MPVTAEIRIAVEDPTSRKAIICSLRDEPPDLSSTGGFRLTVIFISLVFTKCISETEITKEQRRNKKRKTDTCNITMVSFCQKLNKGLSDSMMK